MQIQHLTTQVFSFIRSKFIDERNRKQKVPILLPARGSSFRNQQFQSSREKKQLFLTKPLNSFCDALQVTLTIVINYSSLPLLAWLVHSSIQHKRNLQQNPWFPSFIINYVLHLLFTEGVFILRYSCFTLSLMIWQCAQLCLHTVSFDFHCS